MDRGGLFLWTTADGSFFHFSLLFPFRTDKAAAAKESGSDAVKKQGPEKYPPLKDITDDQRIGMVREIFSTIPGRYDFLNHLLSLRRDVAWRRFAARKMVFFDTFRAAKRRQATSRRRLSR